MMTPQRWLNLWGDTMKQGLEGCRGAPTIVFRSTLVTTDTEAALATLKALLERAGVRGLHMPDVDEIQREIKDHIRSGPRAFRISAALEKKLGLEAGEKPVVDTTTPVLSAEQVRRHLVSRRGGSSIAPALPAALSRAGGAAPL